MLRSLSRLGRLALVCTVALSGAAVGCSSGGDPIVLPDIDITGNYVATYFHVTPTGKPTIDVLARGGSLAIQIAANKTTTGTLIIPQDVFGSAQTVSMAGTVAQSGHSVNDGSARIEVILTRQ
jgi:hypothetical protein